MRQRYFMAARQWRAWRGWRTVCELWYGFELLLVIAALPGWCL